MFISACSCHVHPDLSPSAAFKVPKGCVVTFRKITSKYATAGIGMTSVTGVAGCQYQCLQDIRSGTLYFHYSADERLFLTCGRSSVLLRQPLLLPILCGGRYF